MSLGPGDQEPEVTVDDLWPGAYDEARRRIPLPDVAPLAPPVFQGTLVNAPLWLAVTPPDPVTARAEAGSVWAQVDATFVGLTWDMGVPDTDDDVVECDGAGDPWTGEPPIWAEEQWPTPPCGYNYEQPSTPEHTGNGNFWYDVTVDRALGRAADGLGRPRRGVGPDRCDVRVPVRRLRTADCGPGVMARRSAGSVVEAAPGSPAAALASRPAGLRLRPQRPARAFFAALVVVAAVVAMLALYTEATDRSQVLALTRTVLAGDQAPRRGPAGCGDLVRRRVGDGVGGAASRRWWASTPRCGCWKGRCWWPTACNRSRW